MSQPRILVTTAAGKTGLPTALRLREEGFPVTAFVRRADARSERLAQAGADVVVGSALDLADVRRALDGAERAYFCTPLGAGALRATAIFALAARGRLESLVAMSQWLANPFHPALHTRETWLADDLLAQLPGMALTLNGVGFFADNDLQMLPMAAQFGVLALPYGKGRNAAPSNEDIAHVNAEILARPDGHAGRRYRPTGPRLLSGEEIAEIVGGVLGRRVRYLDAPFGVAAKVIKGSGLPDYVIAQYEAYVQDYRRGAFEVSAPNDDFRRVTGRDPEAYESIVRRYVAAMPDARRSPVAALRLMGQATLWMIRPAPRLRRHRAEDDFSIPSHVQLSVESSEWRAARRAFPDVASTSA